jgi:hypothetical protein
MHEAQPEILKLDEHDRKVVQWLMRHSPREVQDWIAYTAEEYKRCRHIAIDVERLHGEVKERYGQTM